MKRYYNFYPRNFGNEYTTIYAETTAEAQRLEQWYDEHGREGSSLDRVTVQQLRKMASVERHARKTDPAFAGYCAPWEPISVAAFLEPEQEVTQ